MQLVEVLQVALLVTSQAIAAPITESELLNPNAAYDLIKRADPAPVSCGPDGSQEAYTLENVQGAYNALVSNGNKPVSQQPMAGTRAYPRQYGSGSNAPTDASVVAALNAISGCETGQAGMKFFEFPLDMTVFTGGPQGSQGPDRVVAISPNPGQGGTRTYTYCLAMTHRGGTSPTDPSFFPCTNA